MNPTGWRPRAGPRFSCARATRRAAPTVRSDPDAAAGSGGARPPAAAVPGRVLACQGPRFSPPRRAWEERNARRRPRTRRGRRADHGHAVVASPSTASRRRRRRRTRPRPPTLQSARVLPLPPRGGLATSYGGGRRHRTPGATPQGLPRAPSESSRPASAPAAAGTAGQPPPRRPTRLGGWVEWVVGGTGALGAAAEKPTGHGSRGRLRVARLRGHAGHWLATVRLPRVGR